MGILQDFRKKDDAELMLLVRDGDRAAFSEIHRRYAARLFNFFLRMLDRDRSRAEDLVQDVFLKIIENPRLYDLQRRFDTWIFHIAYNLCKNEYRKSAVRDGYRQSLGTGEPATEYVPGNLHDGLMFSEALDHHLNLLDEKHRMVFILRYQQDIPLREIAEILNCPEGTVKSRLFNAIKRLSERLTVFDPKIN